MNTHQWKMTNILGGDMNELSIDYGKRFTINIHDVPLEELKTLAEKAGVEIRQGGNYSVLHLGMGNISFSLFGGKEEK